ncbi:MAG TPA: SAM-dependent methyltransferase, partial [Chlamydiales bacterium]|nr:SAM-dependent methyltransferase [Chlamydiales bacterium]
MTDYQGTLFLLPNVFDEMQSHKEFLPSQLEAIVLKLDGLIAESEKAARRFLLAFLDRKKFDSLPIKILNEHTTSQELNSLLDPMHKGQCWGLISDAGIPCIADPGSRLVYLAHKRKILVEDLYGTSSILLSLMLS